MGGAERNARKRRQEKAAGASPVAKARGGDQKKVILAVVGVVLVAAAVIGGVLWTNSANNETEGKNIAAAPQESGAPAPELQAPTQREGMTVVAGKPEASKTIDVYADFLCPYCAKFEQVYGAQITEQVNAGKLKVRYHMVPMLNRASNPPGYSQESANASLCAADNGKFGQYHQSLFANQPEEGKRGYDKEQLIKLGTDLGIANPEFGNCVRNGTYEQQLLSEFEKTSQDPALAQESGGQKGFSTPAVAHDGKLVEFSQDPQWLEHLMAAP